MWISSLLFFFFLISLPRVAAVASVIVVFVTELPFCLLHCLGKRCFLLMLQFYVWYYNFSFTSQIWSPLYGTQLKRCERAHEDTHRAQTEWKREWESGSPLHLKYPWDKHFINANLSIEFSIKFSSNVFHYWSITFTTIHLPLPYWSSEAHTNTHTHAHSHADRVYCMRWLLSNEHHRTMVSITASCVMQCKSLSCYSVNLFLHTMCILMSFREYLAIDAMRENIDVSLIHMHSTAHNFFCLCVLCCCLVCHHIIHFGWHKYIFQGGGGGSYFWYMHFINSHHVLSVDIVGVF